MFSVAVLNAILMIGVIATQSIGEEGGAPINEEISSKYVRAYEDRSNTSSPKHDAIESMIPVSGKILRNINNRTSWGNESLLI
jgi:hypothetical protein